MQDGDHQRADGKQAAPTEGKADHFIVALVVLFCSTPAGRDD